MPFRSLACSFALASLAALLPLTAPTSASAQGLIDFLWGGSQEWGGGKQSVAFDSQYTPGQIIVSFGDRRLYHITAKGRAMSYPIAVPREQSRWQGTTKVTSKRENPSWRPTPEMLTENPKLPSWVPGGHPMNPLGVRALYLGTSLYRIHGTDAPWTIGQAVSKGCIRMYNEDVLDLYPRIDVGTRVTVTWERFTTQAVASSDDDSSGGPASYQATIGYKQPASTRTRIRNLPALPRPVEEAQTNAVTAAFTRPAPTAAVEDETPPLPEKHEKKSKTVAADAKPAKPAPVKEKKLANVKQTEPVAKQGSAEKLPAAAAIETANKKKAKAEKNAAEAAISTDDAVTVARRAAAAAAKAAEAAREAAEVAKKAAADAKRATADTRASL